jgi:hypothetical protein
MSEEYFVSFPIKDSEVDPESVVKIKAKTVNRMKAHIAELESALEAEREAHRWHKYPEDKPKTESNGLSKTIEILYRFKSESYHRENYFHALNSFFVGKENSFYTWAKDGSENMVTPIFIVDYWRYYDCPKTPLPQPKEGEE